MNKKKFENYIFDNDLLIYESHIHGFSDKLYDEYNKKSRENNLKSKIKDLMNLNTL